MKYKIYINVIALCLLETISACSAPLDRYKAFLTQNKTECFVNFGAMSFTDYLTNEVTTVEEYNYAVDHYNQFLNQHGYMALIVDQNQLVLISDSSQTAYLCVDRTNITVGNAINNDYFLIP